ncbi:hypothetical protein PHISP_05563 [Aspergillus sp. HF37]|nr:hypothetical protein PHISP_05563 [Aspergillus sp. HF37]
MDSPHQSVGQRRGQRLAPLDTSLNRPNNVKRQSSKTGLRILFGRDKPARKSSPDNTLAHVDETEAHDLDAPLSPSVCTTPKTTASTPTFASSPTTASHLKKPPPRPRGEAGYGGSERNWRPPPLFQAYPQAIRYDCLTAPALSAESILRIHASASSAKGNPRDPKAQRQNHEVGDTGAKKKKDDRKKHLRSLSETIGKADWTSKIYVLATSGYILQYAGDGKHDRLPEKILQLGPKSVAFASDAIPGKHWVLQVSQNPDEDVANAAGSAESHRPLFSRLGFHRSHHRRLARGFLLVFSSPEEMSSWLLAVRAEIEARGGKKYVTERVFDDGEEDQLRSKPSARQMVKRDPNRFSNVFLQPQLVDPENEQFAQDGQSRRSSYHSLNRRSLVTESRSGSASTGRTDGPTPTNNMDPSYAAGMNGGLSHPENTASPPPIRSDAAARGLSSPDGARMQTQSPPVSSPKQRQSTFVHSMPSSPGEGSRGVPPAQPASNPLIRSASPPAPNFSVPSFSRRFTARTAPAPMSHAPRLPATAVRQNGYDTSAASFPSPPQSPTRSTSSFDRKDSAELHAAQPVRKPLRVSNSDASLGSLAESVHRPQPAARARTPKPITTTSPPHHPTTATGLVDASSSSSSSPSTTQPQQPIQQPPSSGDQQQRSRISALYQPPAPNRRKSMPGLAGPPAAPPPDYPLPKIPSPVTASRPPWPGHPGGMSKSPQPPPLKNAQRISTAHMAGARSVSSQPANGTRE